ncbi:MAG: hypothetical protein OEW18_02145 [Candidatus Aminicenantes bacterium]|nr:hypothetical protein [Candidatus Aminicenantes bacterium]
MSDITLFVDTIVPGVNAGFYRRMGFADAGSVVCRFPELSLKAMRLKKRMSRTTSE